MPDPAVEAAHRAMPELSSAAPTEDMIAAAREMAKPIRAAYTRWESAFGGRRGDVPEMVQVLLEELAPLIYSTEELDR
ncbi:hypothetical protein BI081_gp050 [Mycobacterium phage Tonenili]|uniref:Uncharacterized protein n=1 Tax=Mycobacterium phage Tonenili TaxID=1891703 RepID=A0A1C9EH42_9CAUD|nr:hypothetical protein BI081_gp050 [Mycobacterium phage Tonenili]AON96801.1 hypothetical protein SEA_TONENILI_50 [Mycobacterium phage Tonenili]